MHISSLLIIAVANLSGALSRGYNTVRQLALSSRDICAAILFRGDENSACRSHGLMNENMFLEISLLTISRHLLAAQPSI